MRTLSVAAEAERILQAQEPRILVEIDPDFGGDYDLRYSDRPITIDIAHVYSAYVQEVSDISTSVDLFGMERESHATDDVEVIMKNDDDELFAQIAFTYAIEGKPIRISLWFDGTAYADRIPLFEGHIKSIREHGPNGSVLNCVEFSKKYERDLPIREVNDRDFPQDYPLEAAGERLPIVYGKMPNCKAVPIYTYATTALYVSHGTEETTLIVSSVDNFPGHGTLLVGKEKISFSGLDYSYSYADETVAAFTGCTRAAGNTEAAPHEEGELVCIAAVHYYMFADHGCNLISRPLVNGTKPIDAYTRVAVSNQFARTNGLTCLLKSTASPARYRELDKSKQRFALYPTETDYSNNATDPTNAMSEIEDSSYATVDTGNTLALKQAEDVSDYEYSKGPIKQAFIAVEFEDDDFNVGNLTVDAE